MLSISPLANLSIFFSERKDGSFDSPGQWPQYLPQNTKDLPIYYCHHLHQADRYICSSTNRYDHQNNLHEVWADALISDHPSTLLMKVADCFPVVISSRSPQVFALIHAGWKPLLQNILELTLTDMQRIYQATPENLSIWIGPGIGGCCYRFNQPPFQLQLKSWQSAIGSENEQWSIDLAKFIQTELERLGCKTEKILNQQLCTSCHYQTLFSHYRAKKGNCEPGRSLVAVQFISP
ncbi:MAG TPA: polyphenol oxidase family protein [Candidatus Woesebacteria bacterium]|nr:polyphenol oxidase family protein [Candidatus Woesebacteria bacterium]